MRTLWSIRAGECWSRSLSLAQGGGRPSLSWLAYRGSSGMGQRLGPSLSERPTNQHIPNCSDKSRPLNLDSQKHKNRYSLTYPGMSPPDCPPPDHLGTCVAPRRSGAYIYSLRHSEEAPPPEHPLRHMHGDAVAVCRATGK